MKKSVSYKMFHEISAGGVVVKNDNSKLYFAAIERMAMKDITIPKGHQDPGESLQETALREVLEETGFIARLLEYIGNFTYTLKDEKNKTILIRTVHWFLMKYEGGKKRSKNEEIKKVEWLTFDSGVRSLSYENDQKIVTKAGGKLKKIVF